MLVEAITRLDVSNYVGDLFSVYIIVIFLYILPNMMFQFGVRPPYSRWLDAMLGFLRDCCGAVPAALPALSCRRLGASTCARCGDHRAHVLRGIIVERDPR